MTETPGLPAFLALSTNDQRQAYLVGAAELGRSATVLEKDMWVCWTLDALFRCPDVPKMAFKGGTSLSKVFNAISRFSEDIDVTLDHGGLAPDLDPYDPSKSRKQRDRDNDRLHELLCECSNELVVPHMRSMMSDVGLSQDMLEVDEGGEVLTVRYPQLVEDRNAYHHEGIKIKFGRRNMTEPNDTHRIAPYLAETFDNFSFPVGEVGVLSPMRTFWEKVTLAHAESNRPEFRKLERTSRHWYDLAVLTDHAIGRAAIHDLDFLADVVRVKERFYRSGTTRYELCLQGECALLPDERGLGLLRDDYEQMVGAQMLDDPIPFDDVVTRVRALQDEVNAATAS